MHWMSRGDERGDRNHGLSPNYGNQQYPWQKPELAIHWRHIYALAVMFF